MCVILYLHGQQPRNEDIRAEDDHEAVSNDHAVVGEHDDDPASREEKETSISSGKSLFTQKSVFTLA